MPPKSCGRGLCKQNGELDELICKCTLKPLPQRDGRRRGRNTGGRRGSIKASPTPTRSVALVRLPISFPLVCCLVLVLITCKQMRTPLPPWLSSTLLNTRAQRHCQGKCLSATLNSWLPWSVDGFSCWFNDGGGVLRRWIKRIRNGQVGKLGI